MGTAKIQGEIWGSKARDWADIQEKVAIPLYEGVLNRIGIKKGTTLLDIGCGSGIFCKMAASLGANVSGIDAADTLISIARERVPEGDFKVGEMEDLQFPNHVFDVVTGFNSFQFAGNQVVALQEASRVSRTGTVVIGVFGKPEECETTSYIKAIGSLLPALPQGAPGPFALSSDGALEELVKKAGLKPGKVEAVACPWIYPDERTAMLGLMSSGPAILAIMSRGENVVRDTILKSIEPFKTASGGYHLTNIFRLMIAKGRGNL